jgi:dipeptidyl aminopeptidase/acylaminoacyl peptidase
MTMIPGCALAFVLAATTLPAAAQVDLAPYLRRDTFERIKISPTGDFLAATVPLVDRTVLVVMRRSDGEFTAKVAGNPNSGIVDFDWVNEERLVVSMSERIGPLEKPVPTGDLHAVNADGSAPMLLVGKDQATDPAQVTAYFQAPEYRAAFLADTLPDDPRKVLVSIQPMTATPQTHIERLDVYNGARTVVAKAPVRRARFVADGTGEVRFAIGAGSDNFSKLYYRANADAEWQLVNDETASGHVETPVGFAADGRTAYLQVERDRGPDALVAWDPAGGGKHEALRDDVVDPFAIIRDVRGAPVGAWFLHDGLHSRFFDEASPQAVLYRSLEKAFPGEAVQVTSSTADGRLNLVAVWSDRNPGDFFLYDRQTRKAELLFHRKTWFDPAAMAPTRAVRIQAGDGTVLHGYLTAPAGRSGAGPLVLLPHGGPFGEFDTWGFDTEVQMLAQAGYAVLQVNYRGSGNYGRAFLQAGARQWGRRMQDDLADATRWAIADGVADAQRICVVGASYGAYAALMAVAKDPTLFRCAVGYAGVYDLPAMHAQDTHEAGWMKTWFEDWIGTRDTLDAISPTQLADQIHVPVLLAAGGEDLRAPIRHSKAMEKALEKSGVPVETLYFPTEGHGFYTEEHRRAYYTQLLAFLSKHLGGQTAK